MKPLWAQTAAGALICAVVAALTLLPAKLLGPAPHRDPLALPATIPVQPVHIALPKPHHAAVAKRHVATPPPPAAVLAVVRTPIVTAPPPAPAPAPAQHHVLAAKVTHTPLVSPRRLQRLRLPRQELRPKPKPASPPAAPTVTAPAVQAATPTPAPVLAAPATTTTVAAVAAPPPVVPEKKGHGHGKGHDR